MESEICERDYKFIIIILKIYKSLIGYNKGYHKAKFLIRILLMLNFNKFLI